MTVTDSSIATAFATLADAGDVSADAPQVEAFHVILAAAAPAAEERHKALALEYVPRFFHKFDAGVQREAVDALVTLSAAGEAEAAALRIKAIGALTTVSKVGTGLDTSDEALARVAATRAAVAAAISRRLAATDKAEALAAEKAFEPFLQANLRGGLDAIVALVESLPVTKGPLSAAAALAEADAEGEAGAAAGEAGEEKEAPAGAGAGAAAAAAGDAKGRRSSPRSRAVEVLRRALTKHRLAIENDEALQRHLVAAVSRLIDGVRPGEASHRDFLDLVPLLGQIRVFRTDLSLARAVSGSLVQRTALPAQFDPSDRACVLRFVAAQQMMLPLHRFNVDNTPLISYFFGQVLPAFARVSEDLRVPLLKSATSSVRHITEEAAARWYHSVHAAFQAIVPRPSGAGGVEGEAASEEASAASAAAAAAAAPVKGTYRYSSAEAATLNYSHIECVLYILHELAARAPRAAKEHSGLFTPTGQPNEARGPLADARVDSRARINALRNAVTDYIKQVSAVEVQLRPKVKEAGENKALRAEIAQKLNTLRLAKLTGENVFTLAKSLQGDRPEFLTGSKNVRLSWNGPAPKPAAPAAPAKGAAKAAAIAAASRVAAKQGGAASAPAKAGFAPKGQKQQQQQQQQKGGAASKQQQQQQQGGAQKRPAQGDDRDAKRQRTGPSGGKQQQQSAPQQGSQRRR